MAAGTSTLENKINDLEARLKAENESHKRDKFSRNLGVFSYGSPDEMLFVIKQILSEITAYLQNEVYLFSDSECGVKTQD